MNTDATIFVVDDDASMRKSLLWLLRSAGWRAEAFASAEDFLARPVWPGPGCLILDVRMPHLTGPQLRDQLAGRQQLPPDHLPHRPWRRLHRRGRHEERRGGFSPQARR